MECARCRAERECLANPRLGAAQQRSSKVCNAETGRFCLQSKQAGRIIRDVVGMESPAQAPIRLMTPTGLVW